MLKTAPFYASVPVSDIARARKFYEETLDLGPASAVGPALSFRCGGGTSCLMYLSAQAGSQSACGFWHVDDVDAVVGWLRTRGVEAEAGDGSASFRDSEGNRIKVMPRNVRPRGVEAAAQSFQRVGAVTEDALAAVAA